MFTTVRVLSYDDDFVDQFVDLWNSTYDPAQAWDFVYLVVFFAICLWIAMRQMERKLIK